MKTSAQPSPRMGSARFHRELGRSLRFSARFILVALRKKKRSLVGITQNHRSTWGFLGDVPSAQRAREVICLGGKHSRGRARCSQRSTMRTEGAPNICLTETESTFTDRLFCHAQPRE
jgi:hypothetical protein